MRGDEVRYDNLIYTANLKDVELIKGKSIFGYDYYLKITYQFKDHKGNEYVLVIPKVELPFIKNVLPNIVLVYDDFDTDEIDFSDSEVSHLTKIDGITKLNSGGLTARPYKSEYEKCFIKLNEDRLYLEKGDCSCKIDGKVYDNTDTYFTFFNTKKATPIKMTKKEIEKRLGYNIEIVDERDEE